MAWVRGGEGGGCFSSADKKSFLEEVTLGQRAEWWEGMQRSRLEPARPKEQLVQDSEAQALAGVAQWIERWPAN